MHLINVEWIYFNLIWLFYLIFKLLSFNYDGKMSSLLFAIVCIIHTIIIVVMIPLNMTKGNICKITLVIYFLIALLFLVFSLSQPPFFWSFFIYIFSLLTFIMSGRIKNTILYSLLHTQIYRLLLSFLLNNISGNIRSNKLRQLLIYLVVFIHSFFLIIKN